MSKEKKTLKKKLHDIYYGTVNLDTECKGLCECCKTAMPQLNFSEFSQLINEVWELEDRSSKIELICKSVEYFFMNEFEKFQLQTLIKPCMLLNDAGQCRYYGSRPLSCRLYGLWPKDAYNKRVDKFEKAYKGLLKRNQLPLNKQCPHVKRTDESQNLAIEIINELYDKLDNLDAQVGNFSKVQMDQKENYRTFHDWLLLKVFGESWLVQLTNFMLAADRKTIEDQVEAMKTAIRKKYAKDLPEI